MNSLSPRRSVSLTRGLWPLPLVTSNDDELPFRLARAAVQLLLDQGDDVAVVDFLLLVGQLFELVEHGLQLLAGELVAQRRGAVRQGRAAAVLAQHQVGRLEADVLGPHDFVRRAAP